MRLRGDSPGDHHGRPSSSGMRCAGTGLSYRFLWVLLALALAGFCSPAMQAQSSVPSSPTPDDLWTRPLLLSQMLVEKTGNLVLDSQRLQEKINGWESFWATQEEVLRKAFESQERLRVSLAQSTQAQSALTTSLSSLQDYLNDSRQSLGRAQVAAQALEAENALLKYGMIGAIAVAVVSVIVAIVR